MTHTPGPWKVTVDERGQIVRASDSSGRPIAFMWMNGDDMVANASLIAEAPTLLAIAQRVADDFTKTPLKTGDEHEADLAWRGRVRAAIARAIGTPGDCVPK